MQALVRVERRQVVEVDAVTDLVGVLEVDVVDLEEGEVPLPFLGAADLAFDGVTGAKAEAAHLARADVDVVGAGKVVGLRRAEEAEAVLQDLEDTDAEDRDIVLGQLLQDREHHVLLAQKRRVLDLELFGGGEQVSG